MDTASIIASNGGSYVWGEATNTASKPCGYYQRRTFAPFSAYAVKSASGLGLSGITNVVEQLSGTSTSSNSSVEVKASGDDANTRRVCIRWYDSFETGWDAKGEPVGDATQAHKHGEMAWAAVGEPSGINTAQLHWDWKERGSEQLTVQRFDCNENNTLDGSQSCTGWKAGTGEADGVIPKTGTLSVTDCEGDGTWCYSEMCASGNVSTGQNIYLEAYARNITTGETATWPKTYVGDACGNGSGACSLYSWYSSAWIINTTRQGGRRNGRRRMTALMAAKWDTDAGQLIGASSEIETADPSTPPVANFSATPTSGANPLTVQFTDLSTNTPTSWAWDIDNDGDTDYTTQNPSHQYASTGSFTVKLTATNADGSDSEIKTGYIGVTPAAPVAGFTLDTNTGPVTLAVTVTGASSGGAPTAYAVDCNDDGVDDSASADAGSDEFTTADGTCTYAVAGTYYIEYCVTNATARDCALQTVVANAVATPVVTSFSISPASGTAPLTVTFTFDGTNTPTGCLADFDGNQSYDAYDIAAPFSFSFDYTQAGIYSPIFYCGNSDGGSTHTDTNGITVNDPPASTPSTPCCPTGTRMYDNVNRNIFHLPGGVP